MREYLQSINYRFSPEEKASIIEDWNGPIAEKIEVFYLLLKEGNDSFFYSVLRDVLRIYELCSDKRSTFLSKNDEDLYRLREAHDRRINIINEFTPEGDTTGCWIIPNSISYLSTAPIDVLKTFPWYFPMPFKQGDLITNISNNIYIPSPLVLFGRWANGRYLRGSRVYMEGEYHPFDIRITDTEYYIFDGALDPEQMKEYKQHAERVASRRGGKLSVCDPFLK